MMTFPLAAGEGTAQHRKDGVVAVATGEFRPPKKGEWFLSGAIIEAYCATTSRLPVSFYIAKLVRPVTAVVSYVPVET